MACGYSPSFFLLLLFPPPFCGFRKKEHTLKIRKRERRLMRFLSGTACTFVILLLCGPGMGNAFLPWRRSFVCMEGEKLLQNLEDQFSQRLQIYAETLNSTESLRDHCESLQKVLATPPEMRSETGGKSYTAFLRDQTLLEEFRNQLKRLMQDIKNQCGSWIGFYLANWRLPQRLDQKVADGQRLRQAFDDHLSRVQALWDQANITGCSPEEYERMVQAYQERQREQKRRRKAMDDDKETSQEEVE
ncbi:unnamed protein product [Trypanosoma congolense IL3000]|uniref:WGS project CAEQ00000000 data, annotated contig 2443 n=1 Tax=Trypanosoma congolense (strain IL3000) TaxID=1068625 RepID=F9WE66_TRYCI|nr:unnamed protein product [Trypanosoma congolense IL3000]